MVDLNFSNIETLHVEVAWEEDVQETGRLREGRGFEIKIWESASRAEMIQTNLKKSSTGFFFFFFWKLPLWKAIFKI